MPMQTIQPGSGYQNSVGKFVDAPRALMFPSQTMTATTTGDVFELGEKRTLALKLDVTAASGTSPTCDVIVETSDLADFSANVRTVITFTQRTAAGSQRLSAGGFDKYARAKATIGGTTPSFTLSLDGEAV